MTIKLSTPKITDFETSFDATPVTTPEGAFIWADVRIDYILSGLAPTVTIRVPIPWREYDMSETRKSTALRLARELIDHACIASGGPSPPPATALKVETMDDIAPSALEGIAPELGFAEPSTHPKKIPTSA